eukprot:m.262403 g.262403  ORF g.262403 m.262403 type:complete len:409 (-) comp26684_c1_seq2:2380-3606(-)
MRVKMGRAPPPPRHQNPVFDGNRRRLGAAVGAFLLVWVLSKCMYTYLLFGIRMPHPGMMTAARDGPDIVYTVSMVKGSLHEIPAWVDYHIGIGVTTMIIFDDNGEDSPLPRMLQSRIETGGVELYPSPDITASKRDWKLLGFIPLSTFLFDKQQSVYINTWKRLWAEAPWNTWLALLDMDEYINTKGENLPALLRTQREDYGVVSIKLHKLEYGVSGQRGQAPDLLRTYVFRDNETSGEVKHAGIALVRAITGMAGGCTHAFETNSLLANVALGRHECNNYRRTDIGKVVRGVWYAPALTVNINHYLTRSLEECLMSSRKVHIDGSTVSKPCFGTTSSQYHPLLRFSVCDDSIKPGRCKELGCSIGSNGYDGSCPKYHPLTPNDVPKWLRQGLTWNHALTTPPSSAPG